MTRLQLVATVLFAVLLTTGLAIGSAALRPGPACMPVLIASSQEKFGMLSAFASQYDGARPMVDGRCVSVTVEQVNSGDAEVALEQGWAGLAGRPDIWSPAGSVWVNLLKFRSPTLGAGLIPPVYGSLFQSPLVIGMPKPMAQKLGYPAKPIGWRDIFALITSPKGWASVPNADPKWGPFKLAKTNPTVSTSGLQALYGTYYTATNGHLENITAGSVQDFVGRIEESVVHYGETASSFLLQLQRYDDSGSAAALNYVSAIALEEKEVADYNLGIVAGAPAHAVPRNALVPIYPRDGTLVADHPFIVLRWPSAQAVVADAASRFEEFLTGRAQQQTILDSNFRVPNNPLSSLTQILFPSSTLPVFLRLPDPSGSVLAATLKGWSLVRKPARVLILVDTAADESQLSAATATLADAVTGFVSRDSVGIWTFPGPSDPMPGVVLAVTPFGTAVAKALKQIRAKPGAADLNVAIRAALTYMNDFYDSGAINAVLVLDLSPAGDPGGDLALDNDLRDQDPAHFVRVFTIGPTNGLLTDISRNADGASYEPASANQLLEYVISNF
jgi:Ca-activated chloride channel homolog